MASHLEPSSHEDKKKGPVMAGDVKEEAVMEEVVMEGDINEMKKDHKVVITKASNSIPIPIQNNKQVIIVYGDFNGNIN